MTETITLRKGRPDDAPTVATLIMEAMSEECCQHFYGEGHTSEEFHEMMTRLVARPNTQYSYENTICATTTDDRVVGIMVCYDGGRLAELRRAFVNAMSDTFGRDFSQMPDETEAGELYLDSAAVAESYRHRGIARRLFSAAAERAASMGIGKLGLLVDRNNPNAERIYLQMGFRHVDDKMWGGHCLKHMVLVISG